MTWVKCELDDDTHEKAVSYRDRTDCANLSEAIAALVRRGTNNAEQNGIIPMELPSDD